MTGTEKEKKKKGAMVRRDSDYFPEEEEEEEEEEEGSGRLVCVGKAMADEAFSRLRVAERRLEVSWRSLLLSDFKEFFPYLIYPCLLHPRLPD